MFGYAIPFVMLWLVLFDHMDVVISDSLCALIALAMWMDALVSQPIALCVSFYDGLWITLQGAGVCWQHADHMPNVLREVCGPRSRVYSWSRRGPRIL